ncbi:MAG: hypothetical protein WCT04_22600 [Planctomycetota bacterium]
MHMKRTLSRGVTAIEIIIIAGILLIFISLLWPAIANIRNKARLTACASNLEQIYHGLAMYSLDNSRDGEMFPASMTNLCNGDIGAVYISDDRVFVCPMDYTKAGVVGNKTTLKPGVPLDTFSSKAERRGNTHPIFGYSLNQRDSSYKYEFSGAICESYTPATSMSEAYFNGDYDGSCTYYLVSKADYYSPPTPNEVDRYGVKLPNGNIGISFADFKFHQISYGDIYITAAGEPPTPPPDGFEDPFEWYYTNPDFPAVYDQYGNISNIVTSYSRSWLPVVRCFWHVNSANVDSPRFEEVQNVSLDGAIIMTEPYWERTAFKKGAKTGDTGF